MSIERYLAFCETRGEKISVDDLVDLCTELHSVSVSEVYEGETLSKDQRARAVLAGAKLPLLEIDPGADLKSEMPADEVAALLEKVRSALVGGEVSSAVALLENAYQVCGARALSKDETAGRQDSLDNTRFIRYQQSGRYAGLYRQDGSLVRVFDRGAYHSWVAAMGCAFVVDATGRELVVASCAWDKLGVYDIESGEQVAGPFGDGDLFIGRMITDSSRRYLAYDAWVWNPISFLMVVPVDALLQGSLGESAGSGISYLFDRPMCFVDRPGGTPLLVSLGGEIEDEKRRALFEKVEQERREGNNDALYLDTAMVLEVSDIDGELLKVVPVGEDLYVNGGELSSAFALQAAGSKVSYLFHGSIMGYESVV